MKIAIKQLHPYFNWESLVKENTRGAGFGTNGQDRKYSCSGESEGIPVVGQCWTAAKLPTASKYLPPKWLGLAEQTRTLTYKGPEKEGPSSYLPSSPPPLLRHDGKEMAGGKPLLLIQPAVLLRHSFSIQIYLVLLLPFGGFDSLFLKHLKPTAHLSGVTSTAPDFSLPPNLPTQKWCSAAEASSETGGTVTGFPAAVG